MQQEALKKLLSSVDSAITKIKSDVLAPKKAGIVRSAKDGIIEIENISGLRMGEVVVIEEIGVEALVLQVGLEVNIAVAMQPSDELRAGLSAVSTGKTLSIKVNDAMIGRIVNPLGVPLDAKPKIENGTAMPLEAIAPGVTARESVSQPVQTGILAIDALIPVGRGQRELIIGDRQTGKTTIALDTIINQKGQNMVCVYVAIGQRDSKTAQVIRTLQEHGAMDYTVVVSASAADPAILQFLAPYAGVAIAEYFLKQGKDALVVYDDLSKHAVAYRQMSLLLRRPPGREAYPGDIFYLHSRLLERAARLSDEMGGGSLTALPIIETQEGDVSAYIPTNVISITDGQIYLEGDLFNKGIRPAINVGISVSRVGSSAQTKAMKKVAGKLRLELAQFRELEAFVQFSSDLDADTKKRIEKGKLMVEVLKQNKNVPLPFEEQVVMMYITTQGLVDDALTTKIVELEKGFLEYIKNAYPEVQSTIRDSRDLSDEIQTKLKQAILSFRQKEPTLFTA
jgi:F-type H+-transporting ATPase subunit alpha